MTTGIDEAISKSLDEIDAMIAGMNEESDINKSIGEEPSPDEVSENTPEADDQEGAGEEGTEGEEGSEGAGEEGNEGAGEEGADTDDDSNEAGGEGEGEDEDYEKSLEKDLNSNEGVRKALEVSEFLQELVKSISNVIGAQGVELNKSVKFTEDSNMLLAKSFEGIVKSQKAVLGTQSRLLKSIDSMSSRLDKLESQPMTKKSVTTKKSQVVEKSFASSVGAPETKKSDTLSKSEAVTRLTAAYESGNHSVMGDILALESVGNMNVLSPEARAVLNTK